jgi:hypothetical protein
MRITERDKQIMLAMYRFRLLSAPQVEALLFPSSKPRGKRTVCQRRLQLLYHNRYLYRLKDQRIIGEGRPPLVYALDSRGADLIANELGVDRADVVWKPSHKQFSLQFLEHMLAVNSVRLVMTTLKRRHPLVVSKWLDEAALKSAEMKGKVPFHYWGSRKIANYPDGYFCLRLTEEKKNAHFFLEVDMGTMTNRRWQGKVRSYLHFRKTGMAKAHYDTENFRVLAVTKTEPRLRNLQRATKRAEGGHHFWFATLESVDIWWPSAVLTACWTDATGERKRDLF